MLNQRQQNASERAIERGLGGWRVFAAVVRGGGRQLGAAGNYKDHTVKCFLVSLGGHLRRRCEDRERSK